jgi:two-component system sensor histidine kinase YesM
LESINALARKKKEHEISKMIVLLGNLLRSNISISEDFIPFAQELNNIEAFLEIHQLRRNKPFIYSINVAKEIYEYYTIKWILQPIVENAIIHGLGGKQDIGEIKVFGWVEKGDVYIQVSDRGAGMAYENLIQMRNHLEINYKEITRKDKHIGLVNVHSRIRSYFGHNYGITIDSKRGEGTTVTIKLPKLQKEEIYK